MTGKTERSCRGRRALALATTAALTAACCPAALAAAPIGSGVTPTFDEAYYATLDYYGNLTEGSVVKSYARNGADSITDYGVYDAVNNLTDGTSPVTADGTTTFHFADDAPDHFYFEGKTAAPFEALPWTISMSYTLNGVPTRAEDLAGQQGEVEIQLNFVPNENASDYAKNNYTLEAMAVFNQDDILSLTAEGAQVQLVGNLRIVLFLCLPGEENHFTIRVGSDDFSFGGMTYLMVPATLSQLDQIADLSDKKDDLEDDYDKLSGSLDTLLDSLNNMTGSLYATANGLDELNTARGTISAGKGQVYADADALRGDLDSLTAVLEPVSDQMDTASRALTDTKSVLQVLTERVTSLRSQLKSLADTIDDIQDDGKDLRDRVDDLEDLQKDLESLERALNSVKSETVSKVDLLFGGKSAQELNGYLTQAQGLHRAYGAGNSGSELDFASFITAALLAGGENAAQAGTIYTVYTSFDTQEAAYAAGAAAAGDGSDEEKAAMGTQYATAWATGSAMHAAFVAAGGSDSKTLDFDHFLYAALLLNKDHHDTAAEDAESLAQLYQLNETDPQMCKLLISQADSLNEQIEKINGSIGSANSLIKNLAKPTASLMGTLADLLDDTEDLEDLLDDVDHLGNIGRTAAVKGQEILDSVDELYKVLDTYEPEAQKALTTVKDLSATASQTVQDTGTFFDSFEALLKTSGVQLDNGTKDTLNGLSATLRRAAQSLATTGDVKSAKDNIDDIIRDVWNDHTGDVDNLLNMDSTADAVSLTDARNGTPQSVQIMIRTQEIQVDEEETEEPAKAAADNGTFWSRLGQMFQDFWNAITGMFH